MKFKEVMTEADGRSQAVRHNEEDWETDNGQENIAQLTDEGPYAIIWHAQYHEWYGTEDPSTGEGRYKSKGDAGAVLAKNIPSYQQAQELLTNPKVENVAQEHGEWGKDLMLISQSTGPIIVPMSELKDHFNGYDPAMQEYGAKPEQYDHHTVIDMANKEGVNEEIDHFANAIKMINSIITEIDENYHERTELIHGPAGLRYMFGYWKNAPHTKNRMDELKKYTSSELRKVDSKPEHVKWNKEKPWEHDYGPAPAVDEGHITLPPIDTEHYGERPGLEGPFRARNGRVVYYDPKEGMYYDPDTDMYISNDDWEAMNEDQQLTELDLLAPKQVYIRMPTGQFVLVKYRSTGSALGSATGEDDPTAFVNFKKVSSAEAETLGLEHHLAPVYSKGKLGTRTNHQPDWGLRPGQGPDQGGQRPLVSPQQVQGGTPLDHPEIDVIAFNKKDRDLYQSLPNGVMVKLIKWIQEGGMEE